MRYRQMTLQDAMEIKRLDTEKNELNKRFEIARNLCKLREREYKESQERNKGVTLAYSRYHEAVNQRAKVRGKLHRISAFLMGHIRHYGMNCIEEAYQLLEAREVSNG